MPLLKFLIDHSDLTDGRRRGRIGMRTGLSPNQPFRHNPTGPGTDQRLGRTWSQLWGESCIREKHFQTPGMMTGSKLTEVRQETRTGAKGVDLLSNGEVTSLLIWQALSPFPVFRTWEQTWRL